VEKEAYMNEDMDLFLDEKMAQLTQKIFLENG
jgi:hypothetical protein